MKRSGWIGVIRVCVLVGAMVIGCGVGRGQTVDQLYSEGQRALISGDLARAKDRFQRVLQVAPAHVGAKNYLATIAAQERQVVPESPVLAQLRGVVLPSIELRDATLGSAIEFLRQQAVERSGGKVKPNLVLRYPADQVENIRVTLSLANIPFLEALRYVCELAGGEYVADRYGLTIAPKRK